MKISRLPTPQQRLLAFRTLLTLPGGTAKPAPPPDPEEEEAEAACSEYSQEENNIRRALKELGGNHISRALQALSSKGVLPLNPEVRVTALAHKLDAAQLDTLVPTVTVVVDCCDNFPTRQAVNAACVKHKVPLVSGAAIRMDGQLSVYDARDDTSPCYACIFPPDQAPEEVMCSTMGVLAPLVGVIGTMQAMETVKLITGMGSRLTGRLQMLDGRGMEWNEVRLQRNASCPVCGGQH